MYYALYHSGIKEFYVGPAAKVASEYMVRFKEALRFGWSNPGAIDVFLLQGLKEGKPSSSAFLVSFPNQGGDKENYALACEYYLQYLANQPHIELSTMEAEEARKTA